LEARLDVLANVSEELKDYHPGTDGRVLDLVHPSMYPFIAGKSWIKDAAGNVHLSEPKKQAIVKAKINPWERRGTRDDDGFVKEEVDPSPVAGKLDSMGRPYEDSLYQWMPAEFKVNKDGTTEALSYINNLDPNHPKGLYQNICDILSIFMPVFSKCVGDQGDRVKVIFKACNYVLKPGAGHHEGVWHVEGMSHEHIIASGIYYYSASPFIMDKGLSFRKVRDEDYSEYSRDEPPEDGVTDGMEMNIEIGTVDTRPGRLIVFPNTLQHKVQDLVNRSKTQTAYRKIICFFLVDKTASVVTTSQVAPQQWPAQLPKFRQCVSDVGGLPTAVANLVCEYVHNGFTADEAVHHRAELMRQRKFFINEKNQEWQREFSLCEH